MAWMAAVGGAAGAAVGTLIAKIIGSIGSIDFAKWAFERDHKGREEFVKV